MPDPSWNERYVGDSRPGTPESQSHSSSGSPLRVASHQLVPFRSVRVPVRMPSGWPRFRRSRSRCLAPRRQRAYAKIEGRALRCRFEALDFLAAPPPDGPFQFVFDRRPTARGRSAALLGTGGRPRHRARAGDRRAATCIRRNPYQCTPRPIVAGLVYRGTSQIEAAAGGRRIAPNWSQTILPELLSASWVHHKFRLTDGPRVLQLPCQGSA